MTPAERVLCELMIMRYEKIVAKQVLRVQKLTPSMQAELEPLYEQAMLALKAWHPSWYTSLQLFEQAKPHRMRRYIYTSTVYIWRYKEAVSVSCRDAVAGDPNRTGEFDHYERERVKSVAKINEYQQKLSTLNHD